MTATKKSPRLPTTAHSVGRAATIIALSGAVLALFGAFAVKGDVRSGSLIVLGSLMFVFGVLLPLLSGPFKIGTFEGNLREDVAEAIAEGGKDAGIDADKLERLSAKVDRLLSRPVSPGESNLVRQLEKMQSQSSGSTSAGVMECANCGTIAKLDPPPPRRFGGLSRTQ